MRVIQMDQLIRRWRPRIIRALGGAALGAAIVTAAAALIAPPALAERMATSPAASSTPSASALAAPPAQPQPTTATVSQGLPPTQPCNAKGPPTGKVNLNTASQEELERLPGVGPSKARLILDWRGKHGAFQQIRDLRRVRGFGHKTLIRLAPYLTVQGATTLSAVGR